MHTVDRAFLPVLLGIDINTYGMSRAFYEEYQVKSVVVGRYNSGPSCNSRIIDFRTVPDLDTPEGFLRTIGGLVSEFPGKKLILIGCGDHYVELIVKNKARLASDIIAPYIDEELMDNLLTKLKFYQICDQYGIHYPGTFIYDRSRGEDFSLPFGFPVILKPSNGIKYWKHEFPTQKKVYRIRDAQTLKSVINQIYEAGYDDSLIIQDFIPGDDSQLRVMMCYSGRDRKVKLMSLAHVMLEEHTPHGLGNTAVLITEYDEELSEMLRRFLEKVGYTGYSTFDIKYDQRDGKFKVLEINLRQGRSNYYVTGAGNNLAKYVVEDYMDEKELKLEIANVRKLWTMIPLRVAFRYVKGEGNLRQMKQLVREKKVIRPLFLKGDNKLKRMVFLFKSYMSHYLKYRKYME